MIITDSAKEMLQEALTSSNNDCILIKLQKSCCGTSIFFQMDKLAAEEVQSVRINEIPLIMDQEAKERTADVTVDCKDGELVLDDPNASSCC